jgi:hypothetical protein
MTLFLRFQSCQQQIAANTLCWNWGTELIFRKWWRSPMHCPSCGRNPIPVQNWTTTFTMQNNMLSSFRGCTTDLAVWDSRLSTILLLNRFAQHWIRPLIKSHMKSWTRGGALFFQMKVDAGSRSSPLALSCLYIVPDSSCAGPESSYYRTWKYSLWTKLLLEKNCLGDMKPYSIRAGLVRPVKL